MNTTALTLLIILAAVVLLGISIRLYQIGSNELKKRIRLIWLAARGKDYRIPGMPGQFPEYHTREVPLPGDAEDPITAQLMRSSEAERRWYALHHLLDRIEDQRDQEPFGMGDERVVHDWLLRQYRQATEEARNHIQKRLEMQHFEDEDGMGNITYVIEDPATGYRQRVQMAERDLIRYSGDPTQIPPPVQQRIDHFPQNVLQEVEQRSAELKPRI